MHEIREAIKHKKLRKAQLTKLLQEDGLLPLNKSEIELGLRSSPYALRAKAMQEPLQNPFKLGFCIMNIAKLRGAGFIDKNEEDEISSSVSNRDILKVKFLVPRYLVKKNFYALM